MIRDVDIRRALRAEVQQRHANDSDTVILDELGLRQGAARVDVAVVNGVLHGYEIKSDVDTLRRLSSQVKTYSEVLDSATVVSSSEHIDHAAASIPDWWGVVLAAPLDGQVGFSTVREGTPNPGLDVRALAELLWHDDALALLRARGAERGLSRRPRRFAWDRVCDVFTVDEIRDEVRRLIKARASGE